MPHPVVYPGDFDALLKKWDEQRAKDKEAGTETFIARSAEPLAKGQPVIVVQTLGPRTVIVLPWADPVESLLEL